MSPDAGQQARRTRVGNFVGAMALATLLASCGGSGPPAGIYIARPSGAPGWIGEATGAPVWSPKGDSIAWGGEDGIAVWSEIEQSTTVLTSSPVSGRPDWAPDGDSIAFVNRDAATMEVIDAKTGEQLLHAPVSGSAAKGAKKPITAFGGPAWSPDGARLAFNCRDDAGDELCVINADGSERRQVTKLEPLDKDRNADLGDLDAASNVGPPSWSPSGDRIAVAAYPERKGAVGGVFVIDLGQGHARRVSARLPNSEIEWYPDGQSILFSASSKGRSDAMRVDLADGSAFMLTEALPAGGSAPAVSGDGEFVSVISGGEIMILGPQGKVEAIENPGLQSRNPSWSPTGDAVAFLAVEDPLSNYD